MKKKILCVILSLLTSLIMMMSLCTEKTMAAASGSVSIDKSSVSVGDTVNVSVSFSTDGIIMAAQFDMNYDSGIFEFVSTDGPTSAGTRSGVIPFRIDTVSVSIDTDNIKQMSFSVTFKAKDAGQGSFSISGVNVATDGENGIGPESPSFNTVSCSVAAPGSGDATLSSLSIAGYSYRPAFAKDKYDYFCDVPNEVTSVNISAVATQGGKVEIGGTPGNLKVGDNFVAITSHAPNGDTLRYNLRIMRREAPDATEAPTEAPTEAVTEAPTKAAETEAESETASSESTDIRVSVNGSNFTINSMYEDSLIPDGYKAAMVDYEGKKVKAAVNDDLGLTLFYLVDGNKKGEFYIYDIGGKSFFKYIVIPDDKQKLTVLDFSKVSDKPEGCREIKAKIRKITDVPALMNDSSSDFVYFYAINDKGNKSWYSYDTVEDTIQRMNIQKVQESGEAGKDETKETDDELLSLLSDKVDKLELENSRMQFIRNAALAIGGVFLVAGIVVIAVMGAQKAKSETDEADEGEKLTGDEDYIEVENDENEDYGEDVNTQAQMQEEPIPEQEDMASEGDEVFEEGEVSEEDRAPEGYEVSEEDEISEGDEVPVEMKPDDGENANERDEKKEQAHDSEKIGEDSSIDKEEDGFEVVDLNKDDGDDFFE